MQAQSDHTELLKILLENLKLKGEPNTHVEGEVYAEDGHSKLYEQLEVIFDVIGTPCWKDIQSVPSEHWRSYQKQVAGRAGNLIENLTGVVDKEALDLLSQMLAFDPAHRCTAEEALKHTYFKSLKHPKIYLQSALKMHRQPFHRSHSG